MKRFHHIFSIRWFLDSAFLSRWRFHFFISLVNVWDHKKKPQKHKTNNKTAQSTNANANEWFSHQVPCLHSQESLKWLKIVVTLVAHKSNNGNLAGIVNICYTILKLFEKSTNFDAENNVYFILHSCYFETKCDHQICAGFCVIWYFEAFLMLLVCFFWEWSQ